MENKEQYEIEKIKIEIAQLKEPFWKKPNTLLSVVTIIITALIGFNSYFVKVNQENISKIEELEEQNKISKALQDKIILENHALEKTKMLLVAEDNERKYNASVIALKNAEIALNKVEHDIKSTSSKLNKVQENLLLEKEKYNKYQEKVKKVTEYMSGYGPGYANGIITSNQGKQKIRQISELDDKEEQIKQIADFTMKVVSQTFNKYTIVKSGHLEIRE